MIFQKAAIKADLIKQKPVKRQNADKWFDQECETIRKENGNLRKMANEKHRQPNNPVFRISYNDILNKYKRTLGTKNKIIPTRNLKILRTPLIKINSGICGTTSTQRNHTPYPSKMVTSGEHILKVCTKTYQ